MKNFKGINTLGFMNYGKVLKEGQKAALGFIVGSLGISYGVWHWAKQQNSIYMFEAKSQEVKDQIQNTFDSLNKVVK